MRRKKSRLGFFLKVFLPSILGFLILISLVTGYVVKYLTHPKPRKSFNAKLPDEWGVVRPLYWAEDSWSSGGQTLKSWVLVYGTGAPGIVLTHGYEGSREDLMDLGYRLWERGYNVMICDLRAHGENKAEFSALGALEKDDIAAAAKRFKELKVNQETGKIAPAGVPLIDQQRMGLYGINISAYGALMAAAGDETIKGIVVDAPVISVPDYVHIRMSQVFGVDSSIAQALVDKGMDLYFSGKYDVGSALDAVAGYKSKGKKVMVIIGQDAQLFKPGAQQVFDRIGAADAKLYTPAKSRSSVLVKEEADEYNGSVGDFFRNDALPPPPPPEDPATTTGTPPPAGTPAPPAKK